MTTLGKGTQNIALPKMWQSLQHYTQGHPDKTSIYLGLGKQLPRQLHARPLQMARLPALPPHSALPPRQGSEGMNTLHSRSLAIVFQAC